MNHADWNAYREWMKSHPNPHPKVYPTSLFSENEGASLGRERPRDADTPGATPSNLTERR